MRLAVAKRFGVWCVAWVVGTLVGVGSAGAQGVQVALVPAVSEVAPGAVFDLDLTIPQAGSPLNAFDAVIGWDPAVLTLIPLSPTSLQQGTLMTDACGNRFHRFTPATGSATIADVLLCAGVSVSGPGQIYRLHFQASNTAQVTQVRFLPGLQFYNAGLFVLPVSSADATVYIGVPVGVDGPAPATPLGLRIVTNPARGGAVFAIQADRAGRQRVSVMDLRGRLVRRFDDSSATAGSRTVVWDGRDAAGRPVPSGVYLVTLTAGGRMVSNRVALTR